MLLLRGPSTKDKINASIKVIKVSSSRPLPMISFGEIITFSLEILKNAQGFYFNVLCVLSYLIFNVQWQVPSVNAGGRRRRWWA